MLLVLMNTYSSHYSPNYCSSFLNMKAMYMHYLEDCNWIYLYRTRLKIVDNDATLAFSMHLSTLGKIAMALAFIEKHLDCRKRIAFGPNAERLKETRIISDF